MPLHHGASACSRQACFSALTPASPMRGGFFGSSTQRSPFPAPTSRDSAAQLASCFPLQPRW